MLLKVEVVLRVRLFTCILEKAASVGILWAVDDRAERDRRRSEIVFQSGADVVVVRRMQIAVWRRFPPESKALLLLQN